MSTTLALIVLASANSTIPESWFSEPQSRSQYSVIDVYTPWCGPCARLDREVFQGDTFRKRRGTFRFLKVNADEAVGQLWQDRYHVVGYPTVLILDGRGRELTRIFGFVQEAEFWNRVDAALGGGHVEQQMLRLRRGELGPKNVVPVLEAMIVRGEPEYPAFRLRLENALTRPDAARLDLAFARYELIRHRKDYRNALTLLDRLRKEAQNRGEESLLKALRVPRLRALVGLKKDALAMVELERWLRDEPNASGAITWFCGKQNFATKWAESLARTVLKEQPKSASMLDNLALLLARQGRVEDAIDALVRARQIDPEDDWLRLHEKSLRETGKSPL